MCTYAGVEGFIEAEDFAIAPDIVQLVEHVIDAPYASVMCGHVDDPPEMLYVKSEFPRLGVSRFVELCVHFWWCCRICPSWCAAAGCEAMTILIVLLDSAGRT